MENRKSFKETPKEYNAQFTQDGLNIYQEMRKKYPETTVKDLNNILNGLCAALIILGRYHVEKSDRQQFTQLIYQIIQKNIL